MFINCDRKLLLLLIFLVASIFNCRKKEIPLYVDCYEYELNLPQTYNIKTAKWSPDGTKMLILTTVEDNIGIAISYHLLIVNTARKDSFEEVLSFPSEYFWLDITPCWLTDSTFIFNAEQRINDPLRNNPYIIYKFNIVSRETTRVYEDFYIFLRDVFNQNILFIKPPEDVFFAHGSPHHHGVISLYKKSLKNKYKPVRLTSLHPDTLLILSGVYSARFISNNNVVLEKCVIKTKYGKLFRRLELLNLSNNRSQLLKEYKSRIENAEGTGFEASPTGEWLIYSSDLLSIPHPTDNTIRLLSITNPEIEKRLVLRRNYGEKKPFSYRRFSFWAVDWSPKGDKILCIGEERKTKERKLYIIKLPDQIN